jgi:2-C-methyl-D-erythritol 4-phosphate cytidylyltransferase
VDSVRAALAVVPAAAEVIVVHDAARPLATERLFAQVIAAVRAGEDGAVPGLPIADAVRRVEGARVVESVDRDGLHVVQTPQAFRADALRAAHARGDDATDDASLVDASGGSVLVIPGEATNLKITTPQDLEIADALLVSGALAADLPRRARS